MDNSETADKRPPEDQSIPLKFSAPSSDSSDEVEERVWQKDAGSQRDSEEAQKSEPEKRLTL